MNRISNKAKQSEDRVSCKEEQRGIIDSYKSKNVMAKAAFRRKNAHFTRKRDLNLRKKQVKCYI
jgi:hypothetical protein